MPVTGVTLEPGVTLEGGAVGVGMTGDYQGAMAVVASQNFAADQMIYAWPFDSKNGFGTAYSQPSGKPTGVGGGTQPHSVKFTPSGQAVISSTYNTPTLNAWAWTNASGFGTKYSTPTGVSAGQQGGWVSINNAGDAVIAYNVKSTEYITTFAWSDSTGFGSTYSAPADMPAASGLGAKMPAWTPDDSAVVFGWDVSPYIYAWRWSSATGYGSKYSNPAVAANDVVSQVTFNPAGTVVAASTDASNIVMQAWQWNNSTGFGTKYADPTTLPNTTQSYAIAFNPTGTAVAIGYTAFSGTLRIISYAWSDATGFGAKYANPATLPSSNVLGVKWTPDNQCIAMVINNVSFPWVYAWTDAAGFGTKYANPATQPNGETPAFDISP